MRWIIVKPKQLQYQACPRKLNVGCGKHLHGDWCNIDLVSHDRSVIRYDIRKGLPFADGHFEMVYHSHVLEHLSPEDGERLCRECYRVLEPGGILRVVVPDLEVIARLYLQTMRQAWNGDRQAEKNYEWMKLELLDQLVRHQSGGQMGPYMMNDQKDNLEFVRSRIGMEFDSCRANQPSERRFLIRDARITVAKRWSALRTGLALRLVGWILGRDKRDALSEGLFRQQGEIHRWMYDRLSLKRLCQQCGFHDFQVCRADESKISEFPSYHLDSVNGDIRKPDSLFIECRKYAVAQAKAA